MFLYFIYITWLFTRTFPRITDYLLSLSLLAAVAYAQCAINYTPCGPRRGVTDRSEPLKGLCRLTIQLKWPILAVSTHLKCPHTPSIDISVNLSELACGPVEFEWVQPALAFISQMRRKICWLSQPAVSLENISDHLTNHPTTDSQPKHLQFTLPLAGQKMFFTITNQHVS